METMLELSNNADHDTFATYAIVTFAIIARFWPALRKHIEKNEEMSNQRMSQ